MKQAFVALASGTKYQEFIFDYIFFCNKAYPECDVIIIHTNKLKKKYLESIKFLEKMEFRFKTIFLDEEKYLALNKMIKKSSQVRRSLRWLIDLPVFHEYDEIYIGDIDLFIMKEEKNLFTSHRIHSEFIKLPYSDIVRKEQPIPQFNFLLKIAYILKFGKLGIVNLKNQKNFQPSYSMTGLRYIKVEPYFKCVSKNIKSYIDKFSVDFFQKQNQNNKYNLCCFTDEQLLCDLMLDSFEFIPKQCTSNISICDNENSFNYRPHHGIHVGMFRKTIPNNSFVNSELFYSYLLQFNKLQNDPVFKYNEKNRSSKYKKEIQRILTLSKKLKAFNSPKVH